MTGFSTTPTTVAPAGRQTTRSKLVRRLMLTILITLAFFYISFGAFLWWAMHLPPEQIGRVMSRMPAPVVFLGYPFQTLWVHARAGNLQVGDRAPDFNLMKVDKTGTVRLSELNQGHPVVLIFGSYT
jgi:hypothetical protein